MSAAVKALFGSRKFLLASVTAIIGVLTFYGLVPSEVLAIVGVWAGTLILAITAEDVAEKL